MARGGGLQKPRGLYERGLLTRKKRKPDINEGDTIREHFFHQTTNLNSHYIYRFGNKLRRRLLKEAKASECLISSGKEFHIFGLWKNTEKYLRLVRHWWSVISASSYVIRVHEVIGDKKIRNDGVSNGLCHYPLLAPS